MPLPQMPGAPSFDGTNVTAPIEKYESLARSTNCDASASAVIGHFPYHCTEEVRGAVLMLLAYAYCDHGPILAGVAGGDARCLPCAR